MYREDQELREQVDRMITRLHYARLAANRYDSCRESLRKAIEALEKLQAEVFV